MRLKRNVTLGAVLCVVGIGAVGVAVAQAPVADRWSQLSAANNLNHEGNTPFHLKMTFQLYDLVGKPSETGTVEEWWAPNKFKRVITSPSLNDDGSSPRNDSPAVVRERYLVERLIGMAVQPVPKLDVQQVGKLADGPRKFGKATLDCITSEPGKDATPFLQPPTLCLEPKSDELRALVSSTAEETVVRNSIGKFRDTYVALDVQMSLVGRDAITGKITTLQAIDPAKTEELSSQVDAAGSPDASKMPSMSGGVIAGHRVKFVQPVFPPGAKMEHKSGTIQLHAMISKDGSIKDLVPIAVSSDVFTDAAIEAVRQWRYSPYLLNGQPTEVDTTITVTLR
jgi:TonB family protein